MQTCQIMSDKKAEQDIALDLFRVIYCFRAASNNRGLDACKAKVSTSAGVQRKWGASSQGQRSEVHHFVWWSRRSVCVCGEIRWSEDVHLKPNWAFFFSPQISQLLTETCSRFTLHPVSSVCVKLYSILARMLHRGQHIFSFSWTDFTKVKLSFLRQTEQLQVNRVRDTI